MSSFNGNIAETTEKDKTKSRREVSNTVMIIYSGVGSKALTFYERSLCFTLLEILEFEIQLSGFQLYFRN